MTTELLEHSGKNYQIIAVEAVAHLVNRSWFDAEFWQKENSIVGENTGRTTAFFIDFKEHSMVLRHYHRGGLMAKIFKDTYTFTGYRSARSRKELELLDKMFSLGLPVPKPIAALVEKSSFWRCKNAILIERIKNSMDGFHCLKAGEWNLETWHELGKMIRLFHQSGVYHSDMNIHNILLDTSGKFWLIDFDKCDLRKPETGWQKETLNRLNRSLRKEKSKFPHFHFDDRHWQSLLTGYNNEAVL